MHHLVYMVVPNAFMFSDFNFDHDAGNRNNGKTDGNLTMGLPSSEDTVSASGMLQKIAPCEKLFSRAQNKVKRVTFSKK